MNTSAFLAKYAALGVCWDCQTSPVCPSHTTDPQGMCDHCERVLNVKAKTAYTEYAKTHPDQESIQFSLLAGSLTGLAMQLEKLGARVADIEKKII